MTADIPGSLQAASALFSIFLKKNGYPEEVFWADASNIIWNGEELRVRKSGGYTYLEEANRAYLVGVQRGLGVCLDAFAKTSDVTVATVFVPADDDERQRALIGKGQLKLAACVNPFRARQVTNSLGWLLASTWHHKSTLSFIQLSVFRFQRRSVCLTKNLFI